MRIAISGSHATGKSTLVAALAERWPSYVAVEEAYFDSESEIGTAELSVDTLEPQMIRSLELVKQPRQPDAIFDRSPLDYLAYLRVIDPDWDITPWLTQVRDALDSLDLIVFVPVESPDRIPVGADEHPRVRRRVDQLLREVLLEDTWGLGLEPCEVSGSLDRRIALVEARCGKSFLHG